MADSEINQQTVTIEVDSSPPGYQSATRNNTENNDSPPSYDSLYAQLKKAKEDSKNPADYVVKACAILCGSILITVLFALSAAIPIAMIVIGAIYKDECPIEKKIPIWLIVSGSFGCLSALLRTCGNCYNIMKKRKDSEYKESKKGCLTSIIEIFLFAWFICGNVWVYGISKTVSYEPTSLNYCNSTCYLFSFWMITISWILLAFTCFCCCCILLVVGCGFSIAALAGKS